MYTQSIWERNHLISITNEIHKCKNISTQIQLSSKCKYKLFKMDDLWHMRTCDFLWKYGMIWNFYERIGWGKHFNSEFLCSTYMSSLGTKYQIYHWLCIGTRNIKRPRIQILLVCTWNFVLDLSKETRTMP